ncbi:hypothetical protein CC86DRAFT_452807 [Ophiobolus disseminans]|uniref:Uncharacterized protein n=1 Tax=Ophiobolus disseminans TaxID=1469910 RepID=A0A6A7AAS0_9PLEO|nr:hypothetical protein CC86DRAFT_452807 [Ophiobolus disseminans]
MDGIRKTSQSAFDNCQKFIKGGHGQTFESLAISQSNSRGPSVNRSCLVETELPEWIAAWDATTEATLKLVCLPAEPDTSLKVSRDVFSMTMDCMRADPSMLYLICHTKDGFHSFPGNADRDGLHLPTWYVGTSRYAVLWTFEARHCVTRGVIIERQRDAFKGLTDVVSNFTDCIHAPQVMCLALPLFQIHFYDARTESALNDMRNIEKSIGFGPRRTLGHWEGDKSGGYEASTGMATFAIDEIFALSQKVHEVAGKIKNSDRLRRSAMRMLDDVLYASRAADVDNKKLGGHRERYCLALHKLGEAVPVLQRQIWANADYMAYMQYRAENLSQVIIALLTHEDAAASIDLATASRKDTSSMKTIAIMTMIFLPATFFAALFSVPLLQWDQPQPPPTGSFTYGLGGAEEWKLACPPAAQL